MVRMQVARDRQPDFSRPVNIKVHKSPAAGGGSSDGASISGKINDLCPLVFSNPADGRFGG